MRKGKESGKKAVAMTAAAVMALSMLGGCGTGGENAEAGEQVHPERMHSSLNLSVMLNFL